MLGFGADEWQAEEYISFVCKFMVGMGLAFQMPVILLFLVRVGILDYKALGIPHVRGGRQSSLLP